jgi:putative heme-binding domain-containing protein
VRETAADKRAIIEKYRNLLTPAFMAKADASNGRAIFTRTCAACHTLFGAGGNIGPDLTGANRTDIGYLLENIVDPSAIIGKDYQLTIVTAKDGRVLSGIIDKESADAVILKTLTEKVVIGKAEIAKLDTLNVSMMPEGLLQTMKDTEVLDLIAYLGSPGQVTPPEVRRSRPRRAPGMWSRACWRVNR